MCAAAATAVVSAAETEANGPTPIVLFPGMGDSCHNELSMGGVKRDLEKQIPGVFVFCFSDTGTLVGDTLASFIGNANDQVAKLCKQVADVPELAGGFNLLGFSQVREALGGGGIACVF